ncbi:hypothetical protein [Endozoicomonas sp. ONNA2]|uniref:WD40 repeat domain-containing protein n=1 Tax=Endozoicomonas sp. ONNA2 TaxID=2828741 RepID=UPI002148B0BF
MPNNVIKDPLLRLAYWRHTSNEFLKNNPEQTAVATLNGPARSVPSVTPLADITLLPGGLLALSHYETIKVWDLSNQQCAMMLNGHTDVVRTVTLLADGLLASRSDDMTIKVWDMSKPDGQQCVATLVGHYRAVHSIKLLPDGLLVSYSYDTTIKLWNIMSPNESIKQID